MAVNPPQIESDTFYGVSKSDARLTVPEESFNAYLAADYWNEFQFINGVDITGIEEVTDTRSQDSKSFNLRGQRVGEEAKGVVIKNGKKLPDK